MFTHPHPGWFHPLVWAIVRQVPAGKVTSYGQIASMIPPPPGMDPIRYVHVRARWVGTAMRRAVGEDLPWHRVINSRGTISRLPQPGASDEQRALLAAEGITFDDRGRVDFGTVGWQGPDDSWRRAHGLLPPKPLK